MALPCAEGVEARPATAGSLASAQGASGFREDSPKACIPEREMLSGNHMTGGFRSASKDARSVGAGRASLFSGPHHRASLGCCSLAMHSTFQAIFTETVPNQSVEAKIKHSVYFSGVVTLAHTIAMVRQGWPTTNACAAAFRHPPSDECESSREDYIIWD